MKTKIALMTAVMAFSYSFAQENSPMKSYSQKIDSIVVSEKSKMNEELDNVDRMFQEKKITSEEKQSQRAEIATRYQQNINDKVDAQQSELENATKEMVKNAVLGRRDSVLWRKNEMQLGTDGVKIKLDRRKKTIKDYLQSWQLSVSLTGANLTSKDDPFKFYNQDSDVKNTIINSTNTTLRYENQLGGFTSPVFYRIGLGFRSDRFTPKYDKVFAQENQRLVVDDFSRGNLRKTYLNNSYLMIPLELRFVLNPEYKVVDGVKYLDNRKNQFSIVAGVYGGTRLFSTIYNRFSNEDSRRIVERERVKQGLNNFVFGGKFGVGYGGFNIFIQKDFTPAFNSDATLKKKYGLQIGIEIANIDF
jgi:hypothetical protein